MQTIKVQFILRLFALLAYNFLNASIARTTGFCHVIGTLRALIGRVNVRTIDESGSVD